MKRWGICASSAVVWLVLGACAELPERELGARSEALGESDAGYDGGEYADDGGYYPDDDGGAWYPPWPWPSPYPDGGVGSGSCAGNCGGSAGSCWCDDACHRLGDCCTDKVQYCGDVAGPDDDGGVGWPEPPPGYYDGGAWPGPSPDDDGGIDYGGGGVGGAPTAGAPGSGGAYDAGMDDEPTPPSGGASGTAGSAGAAGAPGSAGAGGDGDTTGGGTALQKLLAWLFAWLAKILGGLSP